MKDLNRLVELASSAKAYTKDPLQPISLSRRDSIATSPVDQHDARESLVLQRTGSVYYKDPLKSKRNVFKSKKEKAALTSTENWTYTKAERYAVLDQQVRKGGSAGLAQAILAFDPLEQLNVDVGYVADGSGNAVCTGKPNGWLNLLATRNERGDGAYIRLLAEYGASQASKDGALRVALDLKAMEAAQELFGNGADPNASGCPEHFLTSIKEQNRNVYEMFLTAVKPIDSSFLNQALIDAVGLDSDLVALLIAHGADGLSNGSLALCSAVIMRNLQDAAMILTNPESDLLANHLQLAINDACHIVEESTKFHFLDILLVAGADANSSKVQGALLDAVKKSQDSLVELLVYHGTSTNQRDSDALLQAVSLGKHDLVQTLLQAPVSEDQTSRALDAARSLEDAEIFEEMVRSLVERGVSQAALSKCLAISVDRNIASLAPVLIEKGAILDLDRARCVRQALQRNSFSLFQKLLEAPCQPSILCGVLPDAMKIQPVSERHEIVARLLQKGVSGKNLHIALQTAAKRLSQDKDYTLIETLMKYHASVDFVDQNGNCICTAAFQKDEKALDLLCQGDPSADTVSAALGYLPVSFAATEAGEYEQEVGMMTTLLMKGARGNSVAEMLIKAARDDHRKKALTALISSKQADANYSHGKAVEEAIRLPTISALEMICNGCRLDQSTFMTQLPNVLKPDGFSIEKATLLAHTCKVYGYEGAFDIPLLQEVEVNGCRKDVIVLLLGLGGSPDFQNGKALQAAVHLGNVETCNLLLGAGVKKQNIALAFHATSGVTDRPTRFTLMEALLKAGKSSIGQDQALIQAAQEAVHHDLSHVELLLKYKAAPNFSDGLAVLRSIQTRNLPLLARFVREKLNGKTLGNALALAREIECPLKERYYYFATLLDVYSDVKQASLALVETVQCDVKDIETATLLLSHGASLEPQNGLAMQIVAFSGSLDLLKIFLGTKPSQGCRDAGFNSAVSSSLDHEQRLQVYQSFLETGITQDLVSAALLQATQDEPMDSSILAQLIHFKASLDFDNASALHRVVVKGDLSTLTVLLQGLVTEKQTLGKAFSASMLASTGSNRLAIAKVLLEKDPGVSERAVSHHLAQIVRENDHDLLDLMMVYQPSPAYNGGESLILSARAGDAKATRMLTRADLHINIINQAFEHLLVARAIQLKPDGLETARIFLSKGVSQELVDQALLDGFHDPITQLTKDLLELLIPYKPNVSGGEGKMFVDAANTEHLELFKRLSSQKPDLNIVIPTLIESKKKEEELVDLLIHLEAHAQRGDVPLQEFVIFAALFRFPGSVLLAKHLLNHGCPPNSKTEAQLDPSTSKESVTLLIFALHPAPSMPVISADVIMEILVDGHDADVSFDPPETHLSAVMLASREGQSSVLARLIDLKVDLSHRDKDGRSALFYASRSGHLETVKILIQAGADTDDGSLHEAAREGHPEVVGILLGNGHRIDFPSAIHADGSFGRTALEELCLNASPGKDKWQKRIHQSIELLLPKTVVDIPQSDGKTMLHLALVNEQSLEVTSQLLAFPAIWENLNHSVHYFRDDQGYTYSPTKYVELLFGTSNPEKCHNLVTLLRARKCKDRFYANTVEQPEGSTGLPDEVLDAVNKQNRADHEQREELKRRNAISAHQRALEAEDYERDIKLAKARHALLMKQFKEQEKTETQAAQSKHTLSFRYAQELQRERLDGVARETQLRLAAVNEESSTQERSSGKRTGLGAEP